MKKVYKLRDLDCANCAAKMEDAVKRIPGAVSYTHLDVYKRQVYASEGGMELCNREIWLLLIL